MSSQWEHHCDRCGQDYGGSHYHCANCESIETTSMLGHYHAMHVRSGKIVAVDGHFRCDEGACAAADGGTT